MKSYLCKDSETSGLIVKMSSKDLSKYIGTSSTILIGRIYYYVVQEIQII